MFCMILNLSDENFNDNLPVFKALQLFYGLGEKTVSKICKQNGICKNEVFGELDEDQILSISNQVSINKIEHTQELKKKLSKNFNRLIEIKSYRGLRRIKGYPTRGQRTHSNAKTSRKKRLF